MTTHDLLKIQRRRCACFCKYCVKNKFSKCLYKPLTDGVFETYQMEKLDSESSESTSEEEESSSS